MGYQKVLFCDECGSQRQETNHWYVVRDDPDYRAIDISSFSDYVELLKNWDRDSCRDSDEESSFFCSQKCLMTIIQRWMDYGVTGKIAATKIQDERHSMNCYSSVCVVDASVPVDDVS